MVCGASFKTFMFFMVKGCCLDALGPLAVARHHFKHRFCSKLDRLDGNALVGRMNGFEEVEAGRKIHGDESIALDSQPSKKPQGRDEVGS